jgi:hypothetical protein
LVYGRGQQEWAVVKRLEVRYGRGRDLLGAYWGYLAHGGLVLDHQDGVTEGQSVAVNVRIDATNQAHELTGRVVSKPGRPRTVIAFEGAANNELLRAAIEERAVDLEAQVRAVDRGSAYRRARISNIGPDGCTLRLAEGDLEVGTSIQVRTGGIEILGCVVWSLDEEVGVMFAFDEQPEAESAVLDYLRALD